MDLVSCSLSDKYSQSNVIVDFFCQWFFELEHFLIVLAIRCLLPLVSLLVCDICQGLHLIVGKAIKSFWVILVKFPITSAVLFAASLGAVHLHRARNNQFSCYKNKLHKKVPKIEPYGTFHIIFAHVLQENPIFFFVFDSEGDLESFSKQRDIVYRHVVLNFD